MSSLFFRIPIGIRFILLSTLCFALVNIGVKALSNPTYFGFQKIPAQEIVLFRSVISFILSYFMLKRRKLPILGFNKKWLLIRGFFGTAALTLFFFTIQHVDLSIATVLQYLSPIFTLFIAYYLFREKIVFLQWIMVIVAFIGVILIGYSKFIDTEKNLLWFGLGIISAFFSGIAYNAIIKCKTTDSSLNVVIYFPMIATPIMSVWCLFEFVLPGIGEFVLLIVIGILTQVAQIFMTKALHNGHASEVIPFKYFGAVYAILIGYIIFDERLVIYSQIGIVLILVGVIGAQVLKKRPQNIKN
jgi:drug/metabolite transporter (DMT)-like permease